MDIKISGWKTKTGAALLALAGVITAVIPVLPATGAAVATAAAWMKFASALFAASGAAILGLGISHKIQKGPDVTKTNPPA